MSKRYGERKPNREMMICLTCTEPKCKGYCDKIRQSKPKSKPKGGKQKNG